MHIIQNAKLAGDPGENYSVITPENLRTEETNLGTEYSEITSHPVFHSSTEYCQIENKDDTNIGHSQDSDIAEYSEVTNIMRHRNPENSQRERVIHKSQLQEAKILKTLQTLI